MSPSVTSAYEAFRTQLEDLIPHGRAFARLLCRNDRAKADDLAQDALVRAWKARERFIPGTSMKAWVFVITRNLFYSDLRRSWRSVPYDEIAAERTLQVKPAQTHQMDLDDVRRAMSTLPDDQREALTLIAAGDLSYEAVAEICGCAVGTIKSRVSRGRRALREMLESTNLPAREMDPNQALSTLVAEAQRIAAQAGLNALNVRRVQ